MSSHARILFIAINRRCVRIVLVFFVDVSMFNVIIETTIDVQKQLEKNWIGPVKTLEQNLVHLKLLIQRSQSSKTIWDN